MAANLATLAAFDTTEVDVLEDNFHAKGAVTLAGNCAGLDDSY